MLNNNILYYPHYTPSTAHVRSMLLYYDKVSTIVPHEDVENVKKREHVAELRDIWKDCVDFVEPRWWEIADIKEIREFNNLTRQCQDDIAGNDTVSKLIRKTRYEIRDAEIATLQQAAWRPIAAPKIPPTILNILLDRGVAVEAAYFSDPETGRIVEENPIVVPNKLAAFLMSRVARAVSQRERIQSLTFGQEEFICQSLKSNPRDDFAEHQLLSLLLHLAIPVEIESLELNKYQDIRESHQDVRDAIKLMLRTEIFNYKIDSTTSPQVLIQEITDAVADIRRRMERVEENKQNHDLREAEYLAMQLFSSVGSAIVGGAVAGLSGAIAGAILSPVAGAAHRRLRPPIDHSDDKLASSLVSTRAKIQNSKSGFKFNWPKYTRD